MAPKRALQNIFVTQKVEGAILDITPSTFKSGGSAPPSPPPAPPPLNPARPGHNHWPGDPWPFSSSGDIITELWL